MLEFTDDPAHQVVDPPLVFRAKPCAISARELSRKLGLDDGLDLLLWRCEDDGCHGEATASASSGLDTGTSSPASAPGSAITATSSMVAAA